MMLRTMVSLLIYFISQTAFACWHGYESKTIPMDMAVYATPSSNNNAFQVYKLKKSQKVCVNKKTEGQFSKIQYTDPRKPNIPQFGYVQTRQFFSTTAASIPESSICLTCEEEEGPTFESIENSSEDIRTAAEKASRLKTSGLGKPLPYADKLQKNIFYGKQVRSGMCGRAVARILRASDLLPGSPGATSQPGGFNGEDAYEFLRRSPYNFRHDPNACNRPGVVLVYGRSKPGAGKRPGQRGYLAGDRYGHVEILGTDGQYHFYTDNSAPINEILGNNRRPLQYCLVSEPGLRGEKL